MWTSARSFAWSCAKWMPFGFMVNHGVVSVHPIDGASMRPTLNATPNASEMVIANRVATPVRGDVVLVADPSNYGDLLIKRIVGVAGDWVTFPDRSHPDVFIRNGMVWVEGDNAAVSRDSREFGAVPAGLVRARVAAVVWPPSQARLVERTYASNRIAHPY